MIQKFYTEIITPNKQIKYFENCLPILNENKNISGLLTIYYMLDSLCDSQQRLDYEDTSFMIKNMIINKTVIYILFTHRNGHLLSLLLA